MGPYCRFCNQRCFVPIPEGTPQHILTAYAAVPANMMATCKEGMDYERARIGYSYASIGAVVADYKARKGEHAEPGDKVLFTDEKGTVQVGRVVRVVPVGEYSPTEPGYAINTGDGYGSYVRTADKFIVLTADMTTEIPGVGDVLTSRGLSAVFQLQDQLLQDGRYAKSEQSKMSPEGARKAHLAAAGIWETVDSILGKPDVSDAAKAVQLAQEATGLANAGTKDAEPNAAAFHHTSAAILAASMALPAEAAAAHRRAAAAYSHARIAGLTTPEEMDIALRRLQELGLIERR